MSLSVGQFGEQCGALQRTMQTMQDQVIERATDDGMEQIRAAFRELDACYQRLDMEQIHLRNYDGKWQQTVESYRALEALIQCILPESAPSLSTAAEAGGSEISPRQPLMAFFETKMPANIPHPKRHEVETTFKMLSCTFPEARPVRGANNCTYLSFGIGYLRHISGKTALMDNFRQLVAKHASGSSLELALANPPKGLEELAGNDAAMRDLVVVLRQEVAEYLQESFRQESDGSYRVIGDRLHHSHEEMLVNPKVLEEWKALGIQIPSIDGGMQTLPEKIKTIATPGARASEAMEYDALARRFNLPFLDVVFHAGKELREPGLPIGFIRCYPLTGKGETHSLKELPNLPSNETFALLCKDTGHSEPMFTQKAL